VFIEFWTALKLLPLLAVIKKIRQFRLDEQLSEEKL
jgi:hypothetical protein